MRKNIAIQGLRGIAALIVFVSHALNFPIIPWVGAVKNTPLHILFDGQVAVIIFLSLSGLFYDNSFQPSFRHYVECIRKKTIRIYIPYIIVMVFAWTLCNLGVGGGYDSSNFTQWGSSFWNNSVPFRELLKQLSVIIPHDSHLINPPTWYVIIEVICFLILPIYVMVFNLKALEKYYFLLIIPISFAILLGVGDLYCVCVMGCYFAHMTKKVNYTGKISSMNKKMISVVCVLVSLVLLNIRNEFHIENEGVYLFCQSIGAAFLVTTVYTFSPIVLKFKPLVFIGNISYEFYLIHFVVLLSLRPMFTSAFAYISASLIISFALAYVIHIICKRLTSKCKNNRL